MKPARSILFLALVICSAALGEDGDTAFFSNVSRETGLGGVKTTRCRFADVDGDGWADVILGTDRIFLNREEAERPGGRGFTDVTTPSGFSGLFTRNEKRLPAQFCLAGDVDNDGDTDLFVARYLEPEKPSKGPGPGIPKTENDRMVMDWKDPGVRSEILLNNGKGRFLPLPHSGVGEPAETTCASVFVDTDLDGVLDLFVGNFYVAYGWSYDSYPDRLFKGLGGGRFTETTSRAGLFTVRSSGYRNSSRPTYGLAHCDWNNDGWPDLLVCAYGRQWNMLWKNNGDGTFTELGREVGFDGDIERSGEYPKGVRRAKEPPFRANGNTFSASPGDFDNDGDVDVFVGEITHWWAGLSSDRSELLVNGGAEARWRFTREGKRRGITRKHASRGWNQGDLHVGWIDFDNDGQLDLVIASSDYPDDQFLRLFRQKEDHGFVDETSKAGFAWQNPTGISFGDFDRDGRVDILTGNTNMRLTPEQRKGRILEAALFRNLSGPGNHFLTVRLRGKGEGGANAMGIGARVTVLLEDGRTLMREIYGGGGHAGQQNMPEAHFGLGKATRVKRLTVRWPNRDLTVQTFEDVEADAFLLIREGAGAPVVERRVPRPLAGAVPDDGPEEPDEPDEGEDEFLRR